MYSLARNFYLPYFDKLLCWGIYFWISTIYRCWLGGLEWSINCNHSACPFGSALESVMLSVSILGRLILSQSRRWTCRLLIRNPCHWREQIISSVVALPRTGYTILRLTITLHWTTTSKWKRNSTQRSSRITKSLFAHLRSRKWLAVAIVVVNISAWHRWLRCRYRAGRRGWYRRGGGGCNHSGSYNARGQSWNSLRINRQEKGLN